MLRRKQTGQSIVEYAILLGVIIAALLIMQIFIKRGYQGGLKESADKMGEQFSAGGTSIQQKRGMEGDQVIKEEVATDATINKFVGGTGLDSAKGTVDKGAYSYVERGGATQVAETRTRTDSASQEKTRLGEYQTKTVGDFEGDNIDF